MPFSYKRKRNGGYGPTVTVPLMRVAKRRRAVVVPGVTRKAGFYGRYAGRSAELKFFDTVKAATSMSATGTISDPSLNLITQATTESARIGRKCTVKSLHMRGELISPTSTTEAAGGQKARVIIYLDKQANGATAAASDILEATVSVNQFRNLSNSGRFNILYDRTFNMSFRAGGGNGTASDLFEWMQPWSFNKALNVPLEIDNTDGAITGIRSNNIGVMTVSSTGTTTFGYTARVRFSDQ